MSGKMLLPRHADKSKLRTVIDYFISMQQNESQVMAVIEVLPVHGEQAQEKQKRKKTK